MSLTCKVIPSRALAFASSLVFARDESVDEDAEAACLSAACFDAKMDA